MLPPLKPYLIHAIYQWINDCNLTPYLLINAEHEKAIIPIDSGNGTIILNIRPSVVQNLSLENEHIAFDASFHGNTMHIYVPIEAVLSIFAKENGEGMVFSSQKDHALAKKNSDKKPKLHVVK